MAIKFILGFKVKKNNYKKIKFQKMPFPDGSIGHRQNHIYKFLYPWGSA